jgi:hypothetical protein
MAAQICETCKYKGCGCYCPPNGTCAMYEQRILTRFDKIKSMSIEEMAVFLDGLRACSRCRRLGNDCFPTFDTEEWLKGEAI